MRDRSIAVDAEEKNLLNESAESMFGTTDVPYGLTIRHLIDGATDVDVSGRTEPLAEGNTENEE